jgi:branched-chain amino acid transport system substrate-binding protein
MKKIVGLVIVLLAAMSVTVSVGVRVSEAEPIKVGVIQALSGPHAGYGVPMLKGHNFAKDEVNEAGGLLGRQVEYIVRDHKGTSAEATRVAKELILNDKVDFLTGTISTPCGMAISQVAKEHRVLFMDGAIRSAAFTVESGHRYLFALAADDVYESSCLAFLESKNPYKKYWAIGWDYAYAHNVFNSFVEKMKKVKPDAKIVGQSWIKMGETKMSPFVTAILNSEADAIISVLQGDSLTALFNQGNPYGLFKKMHIICGASMGLPEVLEGMGKGVPDGVWMEGVYGQGLNPGAKEWEQRYLKWSGNAYVPATGYLGYTITSVLFQAIKKAGTTDTDKVIDVLENMTFDTPVTPGARFRKFDHRSTVGCIWGETKYNPNPGYSTLVNLKYIPQEGLALTEEEVKARRAKAASEAK